MSAAKIESAILSIFALALAPTCLRAELEVFGTSPPNFKIVGATASSPAFQEVLASVNPWGIACHPDTGLVYFSDPTAGIIGSIDPSAPMPSVTTIVSRPAGVLHGIALDVPNNRLFFLDSADNSVNFVNLASLVQTLLATDPSIVRPNDLAYDPVRQWLVITDSGADGVGVVKTDLSFLTTLGSAETVGAWGAAVHPLTGEIYFSSFDNGAIYLLDVTVPATPFATPVATGLSGPRGLEFDRFGRLFCLESGLDRVVQIDLVSGAPAAPAFASVFNGRAFVLFEADDKDGDFLLDEWERRHAASLSILDRSSNFDGDADSAFLELLFNGVPTSGGDPPAIRTQTIGPGSYAITFEGPTNGYDFAAHLTSDLVHWVVPAAAPVKTPTADPLYSHYDYLFNPAALGLDPSRVYVRIVGGVSGP